MIQQLKEKLWAYIIQNNPDLMYELQEQYSVDAYLDEKVSSVMPTALKLIEQDCSGHAVQELCLNELTAPLKPSRYNYILSVLSDGFESEYAALKKSGLLSFETVNLVAYCHATFESFGFNTTNKKDAHLLNLITEMIAEYFSSKKDNHD